MTYESKQKKTKRVEKIINLLRKYYPKANCELNFSNPLELLIATILSAQCTDKRVNQVTPILFKKYKTAKDYSKAPVEDIEKIIQSTGFYRSKAKRIKTCATTLWKKHNGKIPRKMEALLALSGVGRKTANVVLGNAFQISSGVVVDTHVTRLSNRLNLVQSKSAEEIEIILNQLIAKKFWIFWSHAIIHHGRRICKARRPLCEKCFLIDLCPQSGVKK
ncbi:MAG: endonuclease III [Bdellovibrionales bacterium]|nr:endonuclease III [Bdellovibrionales bacterium]